MESAVEAASCVDELDRRGVRDRFETRFTVERMALDYIDIYHRLSAGAVHGPVSRPQAEVSPLAL
jgi:hypothetical protein